MAATKRLSNTLSHLQSFSSDGLEKCRRQLLDGLNEVLLHYLYKSDPKVHTSYLATMFLRYVVWKIVQAFCIQLYGPLSFSLFFPNDIQTSSDVHSIWRLKIYAGEFGCVLVWYKWAGTRQLCMTLFVFVPSPLDCTFLPNNFDPCWRNNNNSIINQTFILFVFFYLSLVLLI